jgi:hypothetical protein
VSGNTKVIVLEVISLLATGVGTVGIPMDVSSIPGWAGGVLVQFSVGGTLPGSLDHSTKYHFVPSTTPGIFNLSNERYPHEYSDYIRTTSIGSINPLRQVETFYPGAYVSVVGSYEGKNDGNYVVSSTQPEGSNVRVQVLQKVPFTTPLMQATDGAMVLSLQGSYDSPGYCPVSRSPDLFASAYIHETLQFQFELSLADVVSSATSDVPPSGAPVVAVTTGLTLLPHGYDTQPYDIGPIG